MIESSKINNFNKLPHLSAEVCIVFLIQMVVVISLVRLNDILPFSGALHALVGVVFVLLPVVVLDKRGRPYTRYGLNFTTSFKDFWLLPIAMVLGFVPIVIAIKIFPWIWGLENQCWIFAWPKNYPVEAFAQILIVALPEEFFYRGYLMGRLDDIFKRRVKIWGADIGFALLISAALFALGHFIANFEVARLAVFFPALVFGWLRSKTGSIIVPVVFHGACNIFMEIFRTGYGI